MKRTSNETTLRLIERIRNLERPVLFLGAGCSIGSGLPSLAQLLADLGADSVEDLIDRANGEADLRAEIAKSLPRPTSTAAHEILGLLVAKGFFDLLITTNWDCLIEAALAHFVSASEFRMYVRPEASDQAIAKALRSREPRVKLIKLHGDILSNPIAAAPKLMDLPTELEAPLKHSFEERGVVILGYGMAEPRFFRLLGEVNPWIVSPAAFDSHQLKQYGLGAAHIGGDDGRFDHFMEHLASALLGEPYQSWTQTPASAAQSLTVSTVAPNDAHRVMVDDIERHLRDASVDSNIDENRVKQLTRSMLERVRTSFLDELKQDGVCLVFVLDPMAPGGTELLRLLQSDGDLAQAASGMTFQTVEMSTRYGPERRVRSWDDQGTSKPLKDFGAVVLVDSVSFSGNTLNIVREYLVEEHGVPRDRFAAAVLVVPEESEAGLRQASGGGARHWRDVISPRNNYVGFEVTFPWGWTTATRPVISPQVPYRPQPTTDPSAMSHFVVRDEFWYIPKPWGNQFTFSANDRASVSLLLLERGQRTSTHYHLLREETFIVLENQLRICLWDRYVTLRMHESIRIPPGVPHALIALDQPCRVLEVARGPYDLGMDIVRLSDIYDRNLKGDGSDGLR